jgi:hypothetical protein
MLTEPLVFSIQALSCFSMTAVIWLVQVNHYPSFRYIDKDSFREFARFHVSSITAVVAPLMIIEFITSILLMMLSPKNLFYIGNFLGILVIWIATQFLSIPCHNRLLKGYDIVSINRLVKTNWIRTITWSLRSILIGYLAFKGS